MNRLVDHGYAELLDDRTLRLTDKGRDVATSIVRRHRLAERLLVDVIGLEWEKVHKEADRWEHAISADVEEKLVVLLGDPATCPHGNPIPGSGHKVEGPASMPLTQMQPGPVVVRRISEKVEIDDDAIAFLVRADLKPGSNAVVVGTQQRRRAGEERAGRPDRPPQARPADLRQPRLTPLQLVRLLQLASTRRDYSSAATPERRARARRRSNARRCPWLRRSAAVAVIGNQPSAMTALRRAPSRTNAALPHMMLVAVVLDGDLEIRIGEVDPRHEPTVVAADLELDNGLRQTVPLEHAKQETLPLALGGRHRRRGRPGGLGAAGSRPGRDQQHDRASHEGRSAS